MSQLESSKCLIERLVSAKSFALIIDMTMYARRGAFETPELLLVDEVDLV